MSGKSNQMCLEIFKKRYHSVFFMVRKTELNKNTFCIFSIVLNFRKIEYIFSTFLYSTFLTNPICSLSYHTEIFFLFTPLYLYKELNFVYNSYNRLCVNSNRKTVHQAHGHLLSSFTRGKVIQDWGRRFVRPLVCPCRQPPCVLHWLVRVKCSYDRSLCR